MIFVTGNEFSNPNYMEKDILHERIGWTVNFLRILAYFGGHFENMAAIFITIRWK